MLSTMIPIFKEEIAHGEHHTCKIAALQCFSRKSPANSSSNGANGFATISRATSLWKYVHPITILQFRQSYVYSLHWYTSIIRSTLYLSRQIDMAFTCIEIQHPTSNQKQKKNPHAEISWFLHASCHLWNTVLDSNSIFPGSGSGNLLLKPSSTP